MARTDTREKLIEAAMELFFYQGYEATSVAQILEKAGAGSGSLYYFFRDKEDLALAVAQKYLVMLRPVLFDPVYAEESDPIERIFLLLANYRKGLIMTNFRLSCPIGNLALEVADSLPAVAEVLARNFDGWIEQVRILLDAAADRLPPDLDRLGLATLVLTTMEGGVMLARTKKSIEPYDIAIGQLRDYVDRLLRRT